MSTSVVKWIEGLRNKVSVIIGRYTDHIKLHCFFHIFLVLFYIRLYVLYVLFNFVYYIFLLLCTFRSRYCVSLCCSVYCLYVNIYRNTTTGCQHNCS